MNNTYTTYGINGTSALDYATLDDRSARIIAFPTSSSQPAQRLAHFEGVHENSHIVRASGYETKCVSMVQRAQHMNVMSDSLVVWDALGVDELVDATHHTAVPAVAKKEVKVGDKVLLAVGFAIACVVMFL